ncbi:hypothetical protein ACFFMR_05250 [Micromonospora andamanensis]|nr:hypothetical protein [Micromonospora andamanensis]
MKRVLVWTSLLVAGCVLVGLGIRFAVLRLDDADKWGSVIAALVAMIGVPMTVYGLVLARRPAEKGERPAGALPTFWGDAHARAADHGIAVGQVGGDFHIGQQRPPVRRVDDTDDSSRSEARQ